VSFAKSFANPVRQRYNSWKSVRHASLTLALWAVPVLVAISQSPAQAACAPPTGGGVAICSPAGASSNVNPVHYIAAASSPTCAGGISTMLIQPKSGVTAYSVGGATLDTFLPQAPGTYITTIVAKDKCGGTSQKTVNITIRGTAVITYQYNVQRLGANMYETQLTPALVHATSFGKLFACPVDSLVYGQPLFVPKLSIAGGTHNVVYVGTEKNSVYAFDADGKTCTPLWHRVIGTPVPCSTNSPATNTQCNLVFQTNTLGITSTMFIDPTQGTHGVIYVEGRTSTGGTTPYFHVLRKLDLTTGKDMPDSPVTIKASITANGCDSVNGVLAFNSSAENNRSALLYANGEIYIAFGSINDNPNCNTGIAYHGWVLGYNAFNIQQQLSVFNTSANRSGNGTGAGGGNAIWGGALAASLSNQIFAVTSNGPFNASVNDWNNSYLKLVPSGKNLKVLDYFAPRSLYNSSDVDLGTNTGIIITNSGQFPHELIGGDKTGTLYVVNRDSMGKFNSATDQNIQTLPNAVGVHVAGAATCGSTDVDCDYSSPEFWNGHVYVSGVNDHVKEFTLSNSLLSGPVSMSPQMYGYPGATATVSANGTKNGIVWTVEPAKAILHAYDATNLSTELYNSKQNATRDALGSSVKFAPPTVVNGRVYVGTKTQLVVYGILP
jgi:hypothetical protein